MANPIMVALRPIKFVARDELLRRTTTLIEMASRSERGRENGVHEDRKLTLIGTVCLAATWVERINDGRSSK
jgi:hypothetical protein